MIRRFLVAEDNPKNLRLIRMILQKAGHLMVEAADGEEALSRALTEKPDVILMDIQLPRMSGLDAMRTLRQQGVATPIIALTAYAMKGDREHFLQSGFSGYISKPIDTRAFLEQIETILTSTAAVDSRPAAQEGGTDS